jgi:hypothetical protein
VSADVAHQGGRFARVHPCLLISQFSRHIPLREFYKAAPSRHEEKNPGFLTWTGKTRIPCICGIFKPAKPEILKT